MKCQIEYFRSSDGASIAFTDLESSTELTQKLGDEASQALLRKHNDLVRAAISDHSGLEIKHTGDGIMAAFRSAVAAVGAALQMSRGLCDQGIRVRIGLNAGEPIAEGNDLFGSAVQMAARITDQAPSGEVLVSNVVKELCAGKQFTFEPIESVTMKGFGEPVVLYKAGARSTD